MLSIRDADGLGMVMCVWSLVDCILWLWASGNHGCISDIIPVYFFARLLRVSRTLICLSFADCFQESNLMDNLVSSPRYIVKKQANQQDPSLLYLRSSMFHRVIIRFIRTQTPYYWRDCLSRSRILHAQPVYRVLSVLPGPRFSDSMGK